jgi:peptidoglycan/LPS O-acetylase OafA/YrhL
VHQQLLLPLFGLLVYGLAGGRGLVARSLAVPFIVLLGDASYALYILHGPVHAWLGAADRAFGSGFHASSWWLPMYATVTIGFSLATYRMIEVPARDFLRRWIGGRLRGRHQAHRVDLAAQHNGD